MRRLLPAAIAALLFLAPATFAQSPVLPLGFQLPPGTSLPPGLDLETLLRAAKEAQPAEATSPGAPVPPLSVTEPSPPPKQTAPLPPGASTAPDAPPASAPAPPPARDVLGEIKGAAAADLRGDLPVFGFDLFAGTQAFQPLQGVAVPETYVVGPGDSFRVSLWGRLEAEYTLTIDSEGKVLFPKVGPVRLTGLTYAEAKRVLRAKAQAITGVNAAVTLGTTRTFQVFVVGEVKKPGTYTLPPLSTAIDALLAAGGPTPLGSLRRVVLRRGGAPVADLDIYSFILRGVLQGDRPLENGDVIVIPRAQNKVWAFGKVRRPAVYELRDGEGLRALLDFAGGLTADAFGGRIQVERAEKNRARVVLDVALADLVKDFALHDGDVVRAFALTPEVENRVSLYGHVYQPGTYALTPGMRVTDVIRSSASLKPDVELSYAIVLRQTGADRAKTVLPFRLGAALDRSEPGENLTLQADDELYVFSRYQFRPPFQARASGAVREPNTYRFEQGATAIDLLRLAGGPTPEALLSRVEVLRYLPDRSRQTLYLDLEKALAGDARETLVLADEDELVVHSVWDRTFRESASIVGEVKRPGEVTVTQGMTVGDLVFKAGSLTKDAYLPLGHLYRTDRVTKEVTIHTFDLGKALEGDPSENLLLTDGDRVTIHSAYEFAPPQKVVLSGMVNRPGDYPYATNLRVRDLVLAGGGLKEEAFLGESEVVRAETVPGQSTETKTLRFDLGKALAGDPDANLTLKPYDKVFVKKVPEWRETEKVEIAGEVVFPGTYYVAKGETLSSVLRRAGGYTAEAYLPGAHFTRESARHQQQQRLDDLKDRLQQAVLRATSQEIQALLSPEDLAAQKQYLAGQQALLQRLSAVKATGRVVVKLLPLGELETSEWNVVLEDGDTLTVPRTPQTVTVVGQVYNPTSLLFEPANRSVDHYLQRTGGPTPDAEEDEIYVVRADGTVVSNGSLEAGSWWSRGIASTDLSPGDTVLVPEKVLQVNYMREIRDITQILYQIAVTAGVAVALF